jgi:hypothetical protein
MLHLTVKNRFFFFSLLLGLSCKAQNQTYKAEIFNLNPESQQLDFTLDINEIQTSETVQIKGVFKKKDEIQLAEEAILDSKTADIQEYKIDQKQTGEIGHVQIKDQKVLITYKKKNEKEKSITLNKPAILVAPANFNQWLQKNFESLKTKKSIVIDFLVWDKLDTYSFKVTYLGEVDLRGQKTHKFKMNINNSFIAAFVDPIFIWYNLPMTQIQQYQGRVAVKLASGPELKNMDALVKYFH